MSAGIICKLFRDVEDGEFFTSFNEPPQRFIKLKPPGVRNSGVNCYSLTRKKWMVAEPTEAVTPDSMKLNGGKV